MVHDKSKQLQNRTWSLTRQYVSRVVPHPQDVIICNLADGVIRVLFQLGRRVVVVPLQLVQQRPALSPGPGAADANQGGQHCAHAAALLLTRTPTRVQTWVTVDVVINALFTSCYKCCCISQHHHILCVLIYNLSFLSPLSVVVRRYSAHHIRCRCHSQIFCLAACRAIAVTVLNCNSSRTTRM